MTQNQNNNGCVFEGLDFLKLVWQQEDNCEIETDKQIPKLGKKAPACLEEIGTVLSLLDRMASCWWVCQGGNHKIERLCGKVASNARGALRLLRFGFYDESLVLCRAMGETCNLLNLFVLDKGALKDWRQSSKSDYSKFLPVKVRKRIEELQKSVLIDSQRYQRLSNTVHAHPETSPQSYNILRIPTLGAVPQNEGLLICLNELARPLAIAAIFGALVLDFKHDIEKQIISSAKSLVEQIGGATITDIDGYYRQLSKVE